MVIQHFLILIWITFILITGIGEAIFFNENPKQITIQGKDIHFWFTALRTTIAIPIVIIILINVGILESLLFSFIMIMIFPFFHDGIYYTTRELLKKGTYPLYWIDQSKTTNAKYSYNIVIRTIGLILGLLTFPY